MDRIARGELFRPSRSLGFAATTEETILIECETGKLIRLDSFTAAVFAKCSGLKTLMEHAAALWNTRVTADPVVLSNAIDRLLEVGLLRPLSTLSDVSSPPERLGPVDIAIPTANRPQRLASLLTKLSQARGAKSLRVIVADGSGERQSVFPPGAEQLFAGFEHVHGAVPKELRRSVEAAGVPPEVLEEACRPGSVGRNRNLLLLLTAGRRCVMLDDDVSGDMWVTSSHSNEVVLGGHDDPREWRFFDSREQAFESLRPTDVSVAEAHAKVLGTPTYWFGEGELSVKGACNHLASYVDKPSASKVRVSFAGLAGDSGRNCSHAVLFGNSAVRRALWASDQAVETATSSRELTCAAPQLALTHSTWCMSYCMGVDNRSLLPPFLPYGRNEDGVFGALLGFMEPASISCHLPFLIKHDSDRHSRYDERMSSARETRMADIILFLVTRSGLTAAPGSAERRLGSLGRYIGDCGTMSAGDFAQLTREARLSVLSSQLYRADELRKDPLCPRAWRAALEGYMTTFAERITDEEFYVPRECRRDTTADGMSAAQRYLSSFGEVLQWWPVMWKAAARGLVRE